MAERKNNKADKAQAYSLNIPSDWDVSTNINDKALIISKSKMKLILIDFKDKIIGARDWVAAGGLSLTFITTLVTADFKSFILPEEAWKALFILGAVAASVWFVVRLTIAGIQRKSRKIDYVITQMEEETESISKSS